MSKPNSPEARTYPTEDDDGNPIPPGKSALAKRTDRAYGEYMQQFGESPPMMAMSGVYDQDLAMVERAVKTSRKIETDVPDGAIE